MGRVENKAGFLDSVSQECFWLPSPCAGSFPTLIFLMVSFATSVPSHLEKCLRTRSSKWILRVTGIRLPWDIFLFLYQGLCPKDKTDSGSASQKKIWQRYLIPLGQWGGSLEPVLGVIDMSVREGTVKLPNWTPPWRKVCCQYEKENSQRHLGESKEVMATSRGQREEWTGWLVNREKRGGKGQAGTQGG